MRGIGAALVWGMVLAVRAQDASLIPRLQAELDTARSDQVRLRLHMAICANAADSDPALGIEHGTLAADLARRADDRTALGTALTDLGYCHLRTSEFARADSVLQLALLTVRLSGDSCALAKVHTNIGMNRQMQMHHADALEQFLKALYLGEHCADPRVRATRLYAVGSSYNNMDRHAEALPYFQEAFAIDSARHDSARMAKEYIAMAIDRSGMGDPDLALELFERAIPCALAAGDSLMVGYVNYNRAEIAMRRGDRSRAVDLARGTVALFERMERPAELLHAQIMLGVYLHVGGQDAEALPVFNAALSAARRLGIPAEELQALKGSAGAEKALGLPAEALRHFERYMALKDSLAGLDQEHRLQELSARYESEKKEKELARSKADEALAREEAEHQKLLASIALGGLLLLGVITVLLVRGNRKERRLVAQLELQHAEAERQRERAEASERAKDRFLAHMGHELRTPLNAILGFSSLLMQDAEDEREIRYLGSIRKAGDDLLLHINDLLDVARSQEGRLRLREAPFDPNAHARACIEQLRPRANERGNDLAIRIDGTLPAFIQGDAQRFDQILMNLLGNAVKFTSNGSVTLHLGTIDDQLSITVTDTGMGIPEEALPHIFDRFVQAREEDDRVEGGTGLGLAIVKELVGLMGGWIDVESVPEKGSTFRVTLPMQEVDAPFDAQGNGRPVQPIDHGVRATILIAEDDPTNAEVAEASLQRVVPRCQVIRVGDGQEAYEMIRDDREGRIDLVLMDVRMPRWNGIDATRAIRSLGGRAARIPIIALTASVLPEDHVQCIQAGMNACMNKPYTLAALRAVLIDHLGLLSAGQERNGNDPDGLGALFQRLIPERVEALAQAIDRNDGQQVVEIVHRMRPQLVHRDAARFMQACDAIASTALTGDHQSVLAQAKELQGLIQVTMHGT
ncbi:MAG: response regulator [Flavobacteriales bacterium]|nr:response regulator [Flavobacteriales bacterium]MCB9166789.1 response regulator [Flavobacteriales bacterium]